MEYALAFPTSFQEYFTQRWSRATSGFLVETIAIRTTLTVSTCLLSSQRWSTSIRLYLDRGSCIALVLWTFVESETSIWIRWFDVEVAFFVATFCAPRS